MGMLDSVPIYRRDGLVQNGYGCGGGGEGREVGDCLLALGLAATVGGAALVVGLAAVGRTAAASTTRHLTGSEGCSVGHLVLLNAPVLFCGYQDRGEATMCDCMKRGMGSGSGSGSGIDFHIKRSHRGNEKQTLAALVSPVIWGPCVWRLLHDLAEVSVAGSGAWTDLGRILPGALPCTECRRHLTAWIAANPLDVSAGGGARAWLLAAHNAVNERLGRRVWTDADLMAAYRDCDRLMLGLELRERLEDWVEGMLGAEVVRVMQRILEDIG